MHITVFTDGACEGNGREGARGGMGIHFPEGQLDDISVPYEGGSCTNQRTELAAIQIALEAIDARYGLGRTSVRIYTDSLYSINCLTRWVPGWKKKGWLTQKGTPVANRDYIEPIYELLRGRRIEFKHVEAHTGGEDRYSRGNHVADRLAVAGARMVEGTSLTLSPPPSPDSPLCVESKAAEHRDSPPRRRAARASRSRADASAESDRITVILVPHQSKRDTSRDRTATRSPNDRRYV